MTTLVITVIFYVCKHSSDFISSGKRHDEEMNDCRRSSIIQFIQLIMYEWNAEWCTYARHSTHLAAVKALHRLAALKPLAVHSKLVVPCLPNKVLAFGVRKCLAVGAEHPVARSCNGVEVVDEAVASTGRLEVFDASSCAVASRSVAHALAVGKARDSTTAFTVGAGDEGRN